MQSTLRAFLVFLVLCLIGASVPTASTARQGLPPTDVTNAAANVQAVIARANALTARIKAHKFAPAYFQPPCEPTKDEGDASLAPYRRDLRELRAVADQLEATIRELEVRSDNKLNLGEHGWDFQNLQRFRPLEAAVQAASTALAAREAELDAMPARACPKPAKPIKPVTEGPLTTPLTPQEEREFSEDFPLPVPVFDDPVVLPKPPVFCTFEQRRTWTDTVYWPTAERAKQNRLKAINTFLKAEQRLRDVRASDREDSPRIALAERSVEYWRAEKERRRLAQEAILAVVVPDPIECEKPGTATTGGTPPATPAPQPAPPITDGPVTPPPPPPPPAKPKLPAPALARPQFERVPEIAVPAKFCSEFERNDFLTGVYNPAVAAALHNAQTAQEHQAMLNGLFTQYMQANSEYWGAVRAERDAWEPIAAAATAKAEALRQLYAKIMAVPVVPCKETVTPPPPTPTPPPPPPPPPTDGPMKPGPVTFAPDFPTFEFPPAPDFCSKPAIERYIGQLRALRSKIGAELDEIHTLLEVDAVAARKGEATLSPELRTDLQTRYGRYESDQEEIDSLVDGAGKVLRAPPPDNCPKTQEYETPEPETPPDDDPKPEPTPPEKPCPPKEGRDPINVGPNSKVGSGAQIRAKVGGMAMGALMGALGGGGGGGGGSDGPDLWQCKIKEGDYTVFDDPATGVSLKVAAKRAKGGKVVIFSEIAKSPDKGTFQTAFLENPVTGETQAPADVGPCDLWGEWKLTVSWTKDTYVNGQHVDHQEGGWSKTGLFSIPGALSKTDAPDGLWKRIGFSNASNGAREIGTIFDLPPGGGPTTFVIHVTRPKGDPVTTVPFVLTMTEGPDGFVFTRTKEEPCPDVGVSDGPRTETIDTSGGVPGGTDGAAMPMPPPPPDTPPKGQREIDVIAQFESLGAEEIKAIRTLIDEGDLNPCPDGYRAALQRVLAAIEKIEKLRKSQPGWKDSAYVQGAIDSVLDRLDRLQDEILLKMADPPKCAGVTPPPKPAAPPLPPPPPPPVLVSTPPNYTAVHKTDAEIRTELQTDKCDDAATWLGKRDFYVDWLKQRLAELRRSKAVGPNAAAIQSALAAEILRIEDDIKEIEALKPPTATPACPPPAEPEPPSILDDLEKVIVPASHDSSGDTPRLVATVPDYSDDILTDDEVTGDLSDSLCVSRERWLAWQTAYLRWLAVRLLVLKSSVAFGPNATAIDRMIDREIERLTALSRAVSQLRQPLDTDACPAPPKEEPESILNDLEKIYVIA